MATETKNLVIMDTGDITDLHNRIHQVLETDDREETCQDLRFEHDVIAAELTRRGLEHNTEVVCEVPDYEMSLTDQICANCVFSQASQWCGLYRFNFIPSYICKSWNPIITLGLKTPHAFLVWRGKQTAIANDEKLETGKPLLVTCKDEAFGIATLEKAAEMNVSEFSRKEWFDQHCIYPRERRQYWKDATKLYVHRIAEFEPFKKPLPFINGEIVSEPELTKEQDNLIRKSKQLPRQITLVDNAVMLTEDKEFVIDTQVKLSDDLKDALEATYETKMLELTIGDEIVGIPIYSLSLVRNPRMEMSKKSVSTVEINEKQEEGNMPFAIRRQGEQFCVVNTETNETMACHDTEGEAEDNLTALNINVTAEEDERGIYSGNDKPKKRRRRKKEVIEEKSNGFMDKLKTAANALKDLVTLAETEVKEPEIELFEGDYGISQKMVDGDLWHFTWSANAFRDREGEIFSTKALENYVLESEKKDHRGYFNLWHINEDNTGLNSDFAEIKWQGVVGRFLVEMGPYLDNTMGQNAKRFFNEFSDGHPEIAPEGWGCSVEYKFLPEQRVTGVYDWLWKTRTSTLARSAAANIWTEAKQTESNIMALTELQKAAYIALNGEDGKAKLAALETTGKERTEALEENVDHKDKVETEDQNKNVEIDMDLLAEAVGKQFEASNEPLIESIANLAINMKTIADKVAQLEKVRDLTETPRNVASYKLQMTRASEAGETAIGDSDGLKDKKPQEAKQKVSTQADSFFPSRR